jgi:hypothetical protein
LRQKQLAQALEAERDEALQKLGEREARLDEQGALLTKQAEQLNQAILGRARLEKEAFELRRRLALAGPESGELREVEDIGPNDASSANLASFLPAGAATSTIPVNAASLGQHARAASASVPARHPFPPMGPSRPASASMSAVASKQSAPVVPRSVWTSRG